MKKYLLIFLLLTLQVSAQDSFNLKNKITECATKKKTFIQLYDDLEKHYLEKPFKDLRNIIATQSLESKILTYFFPMKLSKKFSFLNQQMFCFQFIENYIIEDKMEDKESLEDRKSFYSCSIKFTEKIITPEEKKIIKQCLRIEK